MEKSPSGMGWGTITPWLWSTEISVKAFKKENTEKMNEILFIEIFIEILLKVMFTARSKKRQGLKITIFG